MTEVDYSVQLTKGLGNFLDGRGRSEGTSSSSSTHRKGFRRMQKAVAISVDLVIAIGVKF